MTGTVFVFTIALFTAFMLVLAWGTKKTADASTFFAAGRASGIVTTAFATSIGWMWADVLFSTSQSGYDFGMYGLGWFAVATALSFPLFGYIARNVRQHAPTTVTLPDFIALRTHKPTSAHMTSTMAVVLYQVFVLGLNATITGTLLHDAFGFDYLLSASSIVVLVLSYSLINGLKTSTYTGFIQFLMVFAFMGVVSAVLYQQADVGYVLANSLHGPNTAFNSPWDSTMLINFVIPIAIMLLAQPLVDQSIFQRLVALKPQHQAFMPFFLTGLFCALGVVMFGSLGFIGLSLVQQGLIQVTDSQLVVAKVVEHFWSGAGVMLFILAFFAVVFSTVDAMYCSISALVSYDFYQRYINPKATDKQMLNVGRMSMFVAAAVALIISLAHLKILWMLFILGVVGGSLVAPVVFAMLTKNLSDKHVSASILISLGISLPLSLYGNMEGNSLLVSAASLGSIAIGALICGMGLAKKR